MDRLRNMFRGCFGCTSQERQQPRGQIVHPIPVQSRNRIDSRGTISAVVDNRTRRMQITPSEEHIEPAAVETTFSVEQHTTTGQARYIPLPPQGSPTQNQ